MASSRPRVRCTNGPSSLSGPSMTNKNVKISAGPNICSVPHHTVGKHSAPQSTLLCPLKVRQWPRPIEVGPGRLVEPEIREPVPAWNGRDPVLLEAGQCGRPAIDVHRAIFVLAQVHARRTIGDPLVIQDQC